VPVGFDQFGVKVTYEVKEALEDADVIMLLRTQRERQKEVFYPSAKEYSILYGLNRQKMKWAKPDAIVMHPGPINRGVEIDPDMADGDHSVILEQVANGVATRMAVLYLLLGSGEGAGV
jgi:aspartate carbamoyltransferase catalytic subunit